MDIQCKSGGSWSPLGTCERAACFGPELPFKEDSHNLVVYDPNGNLMPKSGSSYSGLVAFGDTVYYKCKGDTFPVSDRELVFSLNVLCLSTGYLDLPLDWEACVETVECSDAPPDPGPHMEFTFQDAGYSFGQGFKYTCDPDYQFMMTGTLMDSLDVVCQWDEKWNITELSSYSCDPLFCDGSLLPNQFDSHFLEPSYQGTPLVSNENNEYTVKVAFGDNVTYFCAPGYFPGHDKSSIETINVPCTTDTTFSLPNATDWFECLDHVTCAFVDLPALKSNMVVNATVDMIVKNGEYCLLKCETGFALTRTYDQANLVGIQLACQWGRNWSLANLDDFECKASHCSASGLSVLDEHALDLFHWNGTKIEPVEASYDFWVPVSAQVYYNCTNGTYPVFDRNAKLNLTFNCTDTGELVGPTTFDHCVDTKYCPDEPLDPVANASFKSYNSQHAYKFEQWLLYQCDNPLFEFVNPARDSSQGGMWIMCHWNGEWGNPQSNRVCELPPGHCGYPPDLEDPSFDAPYSVHGYPLPAGKQVIYPCKTLGARVSTNPFRTFVTATCQADQSYTFDEDPLPSCLLGTSCPPLVPTPNHVIRHTLVEYMPTDKSEWETGATSVDNLDVAQFGSRFLIDDLLVTGSRNLGYVSDATNETEKVRIGLPKAEIILEVILYFGRESCSSSNIRVQVGYVSDLELEFLPNATCNPVPSQLPLNTSWNAFVVKCSRPMRGNQIIIESWARDPDTPFILNEVLLKFAGPTVSEPVLRNCEELNQSGASTPGAYRISPDGNQPFSSTEVYCENGWTVILRRGQFGNPVDYFSRGIADYKSGFGERGKEFWIGLETLTRLAQSGPHQLEISMVDVFGQARRVTYDTFEVKPGPDYELVVDGFSSQEGKSIGDDFGMHNGLKFSAIDLDMDKLDDVNCAQKMNASGWFGISVENCALVNPFGHNLNASHQTSKGIGIHWTSQKGPWNSFATFQMALKPITPVTLDNSIREQWRQDLLAVTTSGTQHRISCPFGQTLRFGDGTFKSNLGLKCELNGTWSSNDLGTCEWTHCIEPPVPPIGNNLILSEWSGQPIPIGESWKFVCKYGMNSSGSVVDNPQVVLAIPCLSGDTFDGPIEWPFCVPGTSCSQLIPSVSWNGTGYLEQTGLVRGPSCYSRRSEDQVGFCQGIKIHHRFRDAYFDAIYVKAVWVFEVPPPLIGQTLTMRITFSLPVFVGEIDQLDSVVAGSRPEELIVTGQFSDASSLVTKYKQIPDVDLCVFSIGCVDDLEKPNTDSKTYDPTTHQHTTGTQIRFDCGLARKFRLSNGIEMGNQIFDCGRDGQWTPTASMSECVWIGCFSPPIPSGESNLEVIYFNQSVIGLNATVTYKCRKDHYFEHDFQRPNLKLKCLENGKWENISPWPKCIHASDRKCPDPTNIVAGHAVIGEFNITREEVASFGEIATYQCGPGKKLLHHNGTLLNEVHFWCQWNETWEPKLASQCVRTHCMDPPRPNHVNIRPIWDGTPIPFNDHVAYECSSNRLFFQQDRQMQSFPVKCLPGGDFDIPNPWPACVRSTLCGIPPAKPKGGTMEWNGDSTYGTEIEYTCGAFAKFRNYLTNATKSEEVITCQWNTTWSKTLLDRCIYSRCEHIPEPPVSSGLKHVSSSNGKNLQLISPYSRFDPAEYEKISVTPEFHHAGAFVVEGHLRTGLFNESSLPEFTVANDGNQSIITFAVDPFKSSLRIRSDLMPGTLLTIPVSIAEGDRFKLVSKYNENRHKFTLTFNSEILEDFVLPNTIGGIKFQWAFHQARSAISFLGFGPGAMITNVPTGTNIIYKCPDGFFFDADLLRKPFYSLICSETGYFSHVPGYWPTCVDPFVTTPCFEPHCSNGTGKVLCVWCGLRGPNSWISQR